MAGAVSVELARRSDVEVVSGERSPNGHPFVLSRSCRIRLAATIYRYLSLANPEQLRQTTSSETAVSNCT
jgi:hypothetical protein